MTCRSACPTRLERAAPLDGGLARPSQLEGRRGRRLGIGTLPPHSTGGRSPALNIGSPHTLRAGKHSRRRDAGAAVSEDRAPSARAPPACAPSARLPASRPTEPRPFRRVGSLSRTRCRACQFPLNVCGHQRSGVISARSLISSSSSASSSRSASTS